MTTQLDQLTELLTTLDDDLILIRESTTGVDKKMRAQNIRAKATTKADVDLGNADNTSDADKPISTATQSALNTKAPIASPTFTGTVTITDLAGNTTVTGTIDGRNISVDGDKLDGIEAGAQVNVDTSTDLTYTTAASTGSVNSSTGTNATVPAATTGAAGLLTSADKTKLDGIEAGATDDQTSAEIKTAYESNANTNAFTDAEQSKLDGIEAGAQVNVATNLSWTAGTTAGPTVNSSTGNNAVIPTASDSASGVITTGDQIFSGVKTLAGAVFNNGYTEQVFTVTGTAPALSPTNGSIQTWTLAGNSNPTAGTWSSGQSLTILIDDGAAHTVNWGTIGVVFKTDGGDAPTLNTTGFTVIALWKVGTTVFGARVGDA